MKLVGLEKCISKKTFKVGDKITCVITEIDKEKRRIAISHKLTIDNPYKVLNALVGIGVFMTVFAIIMFFFPEGGGYFIEMANF